MERKTGDCPLGSQCETAEGDVIITCPWYVKVQGVDPQGVEHDEWKCAIAWLPILQIESSQTNRGVSSAVESLRNSQVEGQVAALRTLKRLSDDKDIKTL